MLPGKSILINSVEVKPYREADDPCFQMVDGGRFPLLKFTSVL